MEMHNNNINSLRFLGAFFVLFGHSFALCYGPGGGEDPISEWLKGVTAYRAMLPGIGVAMFFVLSGYLVTRSFETRHNLLAYLEARILRIFPALWVLLLLSVFVLGPLLTTLDLSAYFAHDGSWKYLTHNAKLYPNVSHRLPGVFLDNPRAGGINGSLWTLPVEVRMYVIVALIGVIGILKKRVIFNIVMFLICAWYFFTPEQFPLLYKPNHVRLAIYFLLGAVFYINRDKIRYHWTGVIVLTVILILNFKNDFYNLTYAVWFSYLVLYISFHRHLKLPDFGRHGDFSYGLYLYAFPITQLNIMWLGSDNPWLIMVTTFLVTIVFAIGSWYLVERPALRLKGKLTGENPR